MRGREERDDELKAFISARTQDLHHDAFQLTAGQESAERLVVAVVTDLHRQRADLSRAGATAHLRMVQLAATDDTPTEVTDDPSLAARFRPLVRLSPRQRAVILLQAVAGYDDRAISRALQLSSRTVEETIRSIPYDDLTSPRSHPNELRSLLEDFGDLATFPSASTTVREVHAAETASRRPWWTYAAALMVVALTATCIVVTQGWHKDWLKTPEGLNHAHGTHFPTYVQGYQLVDVRDMTPGIAQDITTGATGAVALPCDVVGTQVRLSVQSAASAGTEGDACPEPGSRARLTEVTGRASAMVLGRTRDEYPVGVYRKIPLSEYPVATKDFTVQHNLTLKALRRDLAGGRTPPDEAKRPVLTLHGTAAHHNGTFIGTLRLPYEHAALENSPVHAVGLLSPTTSGRFQVEIDGTPARTDCGDGRGPSYLHLRGCTLLDHQVPQLTYLQDVSADYSTVPVRITVKDAFGPWTLQVVADTDSSFTASPD